MPLIPAPLPSKELRVCEHGVPGVIVCPKCHPEKYELTPEEEKRLQEKFKEYKVEE